MLGLRWEHIDFTGRYRVAFLALAQAAVVAVPLPSRGRMSGLVIA